MGWYGNYTHPDDVIQEKIRTGGSTVKILDRKSTKNWGAILYQNAEGAIGIDYFIFKEESYKPLSWTDGMTVLPSPWITAAAPFSTPEEQAAYKEFRTKKTEKVVSLDDILATGQSYLIWGKHKATYMYKQKRTHVFKMLDTGKPASFTNLKVSDVKLLNGAVPEPAPKPDKKDAVDYSHLIYKPLANKGEKIYETWDRNREHLDKLDKQAKSLDILMGRVVYHPYADGYAIYQVVKETSKTVTLKVVKEVGDDWVLPAWGNQITVPYGQIARMIMQKDRMDALFASKK